MAAEFVVDASLGSNPKFRDLSKRLAGRGNAVWTLIRLWSFAAAHRPTGDLTDIDPAEVPLTETEWAALMDARNGSSAVGFLEVKEGGKTVIHDWERSGKHQASKEKRRQAGRIAGKASAALRAVHAQADYETGRRAALETKLPSLGDDPESNVRSERSLESGNGETGKMHLFEAPFTPPKPLTYKDRVDPALEEWLDRTFDWFYSIYPRHVARVDGRKAWGQLHRFCQVSGGKRGISKSLMAQIAQHIRKQLDSGVWDPSREGLKVIPFPATYLRARRWEE